MNPAESLPPPSSDERTLAVLTHVLAIFTGFLAPLILFLVKRDSAFVRFHALQALIWHLFYLACFFVLFGVGFALAAGSILTSTAANPGAHHGDAPVFAIGSFFLVWLGAVGFGLFSLILEIVMAVRASDGKWARMPIVGGWAARLAA